MRARSLHQKSVVIDTQTVRGAPCTKVPKLATPDQ
jgi:hypothetical protein